MGASDIAGGTGLADLAVARPIIYIGEEVAF